MFKRTLSLLIMVTLFLVAFAMPLSAAEFTSKEFSIQYPSDWKVLKGASPAVLFQAQKPSGCPWQLVIAFDAPGAKFLDVLNEANKESAKEFKADSPKETVTADGSKAYITETEFIEPNSGYAAAGVALGVEKNGKWYIVMVNTVPVGYPYKYDDFSKIVKSIKFVK